MRPATKHWLFLILLVVSFVILVALVLWQIDKARHEEQRPRTESGHAAHRAALAHRPFFA